MASKFYVVCQKFGLFGYIGGIHGFLICKHMLKWHGFCVIHNLKARNTCWRVLCWHLPVNLVWQMGMPMQLHSPADCVHLASVEFGLSYFLHYQLPYLHLSFIWYTIVMPVLNYSHTLIIE